MSPPILGEVAGLGPADADNPDWGTALRRIADCKFGVGSFMYLDALGCIQDWIDRNRFWILDRHGRSQKFDLLKHRDITTDTGRREFPSKLEVKLNCRDTPWAACTVPSDSIEGMVAN